MEDFSTQKRIISLGKQLVSSLGTASDVGPLGRWMSHYIAEQIVASETTAGQQRAVAQQRCFETILKLWSRRSAIPGTARPFRSFDPVFEVLARLDPNTPHFFHRHGAGLFNGREEPKEGVMRIVECIDSVDEAARTLINVLLSFAMEICADEDTLGYLNALQEDMRSADLRLAADLVRMFDERKESADQGADKNRRRIEVLDDLLKKCEGIKKLLQASSDTTAKKRVSKAVRRSPKRKKKNA